MPLAFLSLQSFLSFPICIKYTHQTCTFNLPEKKWNYHNVLFFIFPTLSLFFSFSLSLSLFATGWFLVAISSCFFLDVEPVYSVCAIYQSTNGASCWGHQRVKSAPPSVGYACVSVCVLRVLHMKNPAANKWHASINKTVEGRCATWRPLSGCAGS